jgi:hypothetical protein
VCEFDGESSLHIQCRREMMFESVDALILRKKLKRDACVKRRVVPLYWGKGFYWKPHYSLLCMHDAVTVSSESVLFIPFLKDSFLFMRNQAGVGFNLISRTHIGWPSIFSIKLYVYVKLLYVSGFPMQPYYSLGLLP